VRPSWKLALRAGNHLVRQENSRGPVEFWTQTDETTFRDTFDEEQLPGPLVHEGEIATTLAEAFALLSRYQWHTMTPIKSILTSAMRSLMKCSGEVSLRK